MPVQRIPRYALLLRVSNSQLQRTNIPLNAVQQELVKYTNPLHADHKMAEQAANKINTQLNQLNKGIDQQVHELLSFTLLPALSHVFLGC